ncbi:hypothetical protein AB0D11_17065 [Streptomyces monashensis]|uniref:hypothetical protein n=1 Tax=Streptomyces monashensis TaxID=1678012 RepID=UPI0033CDF71C
MTFSAALLGTTVRVLRTAAGRRALQLTLLVGGLFALGFAFGEQAHAADGTAARGTATSVRSVASVTSVLPLTSSHPGTTSSDSGTAAQDVQGARSVQGVLSTVTGTVSTVTETVSTVTETVPVVNRTVSTLTGTVSTVTRTVEGTTDRVLPPSLPLPDPTQTQTVPSPQGQGAGTASRPASPVGTTAPAHPHPRHARTDARAAAPAASASAPFASYGPAATSLPPYFPHPARSSAHHGTAGTGGAVAGPGRPAPAGTPNGVVGKQAADGTVSRHADAYAVTLGHRAPLRLVPGTAVRTDAPRIRERHRDIPVFPG